MEKESTPRITASPSQPLNEKQAWTTSKDGFYPNLAAEGCPVAPGVGAPARCPSLPFLGWEGSPKMFYRKNSWYQLILTSLPKLPRHETPNSDRRRSHAAEYCAGCAAKRRLLSGSCNIILRYLRAHSQRQGHGLEQTRARECSRHVSKPAPWSCVRVFVRVCVCVSITTKGKICVFVSPGCLS